MCFLPWGYRYNIWYNKCEKNLIEYHRSVLRKLDLRFRRYEAGSGLASRYGKQESHEDNVLDPRYKL